MSLMSQSRTSRRSLIGIRASACRFWTTITFELSGPPDRLAYFLELMRPYGVDDLVKSGRIAMAKDAKSSRNGRSKLRSA